MTDADFAAAKTLKDAIAGLNKSHDQANVAGARASILITNANATQVLVPEATLIAAIGQDAYNTICATAKASLITQINSAITTKTTAFTNLGGE